MYQRRTLLRAGVAATALTVAGCIDQNDSAGPVDDDDDESDDESDTESDDTGTGTPDERTAADTDVDDPAEITTDDDRQTTDRVEVISKVGHVADGAISAVELTIAPAPGAGPIDLRRTTIQWVGENGTYDLTAASEASVDGTFRITAIKDADDSAPVMNAADDRMQLSMDLGRTDEVSGVEGFGEPLEPGTSAILYITTGSGATTVVRATVPQSLSGKRVVTL